MKATKGKKAVNGVIGGVIGAGVALLASKPGKRKWVKENASDWKQKWEERRKSTLDEGKQDSEESMNVATATNEEDEAVKTELKTEDDTKVSS